MDETGTATVNGINGKSGGFNAAFEGLDTHESLTRLLSLTCEQSDSKTTLSCVLNEIADLFENAKGVTGFVIWLFQPDTEILVPGKISSRFRDIAAFNTDMAILMNRSASIPWHKPAMVESNSALFSLFSHYSGFGIDSFLSVPLLSSNEWIGMIHLFGEFVALPAPEVMRSLSLVGHQAGIILRNIQLEGLIDRKVTKLTTLYEVSRMARSFIQLTDAMNSIVDVVQAMIDFDVCILYNYDSARNELVIRRAKGLTVNEIRQTRIRPGEGLAGQVLLTRQSVLSHLNQYKSYLAIPILMANKLVGVLALGAFRSYAYTEEDIVSINILASQIASIDNMISTLISMKSFTENILDSMPGGLITIDLEGNLLHFNPSANRLLHQLSNEIIGRHHRDVLGVNHPFTRLLSQTLVDATESKTADIRLSANGRELTIEATTFLFRDEKSQPIGAALFFKDVSEIRSLKEQLRRADRLSALGELSMAVAHEIRNPLTGIKMVVQLLQNELASDDPRQEHAHIVINEVDRLEKIIADLLAFAKPASPSMSETDLGSIMQATLLLVSEIAAKQGTTIHKEVEENLPRIYADSFQIRQVLLNVLQNALQAVDRNGCIRIQMYRKGPAHVALCITDNGRGIEKQHIHQIFDPFFTTRDRGTGLGLAIAARIIEEHNGTIDIKSEVGQPVEWSPDGGTRVTIVLPCYKEGAGE